MNKHNVSLFPRFLPSQDLDDVIQLVPHKLQHENFFGTAAISPNLIVCVSAVRFCCLCRPLLNPFFSAFRFLMKGFQNPLCRKFFEIPDKIRKFAFFRLNDNVNMIAHDDIPKKNHNLIFDAEIQAIYNNNPVTFPCKISIQSTIVQVKKWGFSWSLMIYPPFIAFFYQR